MTWPFRSKAATSPKDRLPILYFKGGSEFLEYQCKFGHTSIEKGVGIVGLVLDAAKEYGVPVAVKVEDDGTQLAMIKVASDDGGFVVAAKTPTGGDKLVVGDVVIWVPMTFNREAASKVPDQRFGWIGLIRAKVAPQLDVNPGAPTNGFKLLWKY